MVDDFIVCGIISCWIVMMLREVGVIEVYVKISLLLIVYLCFYGIDIFIYEELIVFFYLVEEICQEIGVDIFLFLSVEGLLKGIGRKYDDFNCGQCFVCFIGKYLIEIYQDIVFFYVKEVVLIK